MTLAESTLGRCARIRTEHRGCARLSRLDTPTNSHAFPPPLTTPPDHNHPATAFVPKPLPSRTLQRGHATDGECKHGRHTESSGDDPPREVRAFLLHVLNQPFKRITADITEIRNKNTDVEVLPWNRSVVVLARHPSEYGPLRLKLVSASGSVTAQCKYRRHC